MEGQDMIKAIYFFEVITQNKILPFSYKIYSCLSFHILV
ncbi:hypothetical protein HMPREF1253_0017 [Peptoniphilus sp. BV3C26]|nr:hypothetical protein HMPREF1253_0017 [Peptoniphilus sp. BV3C26]